MSERARRILFCLSGLVLGGVIVRALLELPPSGRGISVYGDLIVGATVEERHSPDAITAINFDYRGFDTLGEEFILFTAVIGVVLLLRKSADHPASSDERDSGRGARPVRGTSDAVRALGLALVGLTVVFGLYVMTHGQLSPGGGFQGGVIVASGWMVLYLAGDARTYERLSPPGAVEAVEAIGAAAYALLGFGGLFASGAFLANFIPLGPVATIRSGGTIALLSAAVGVEVTGGFILLITTFVQEALADRDRE